MSSPGCCTGAPASAGSPASGTRASAGRPLPASPWRRALGVAGCAVPGATLLLLPKCPFCLAAWLAMATGIGVAASTAAHLRTALVVLCLLSLGAFAARQVLRRRGRRAIAAGPAS